MHDCGRDLFFLFLVVAALGLVIGAGAKDWKS